MRYELEHGFDWSGDTPTLLRLLYADPALNDALAAMRHLRRREITRLVACDRTGRAERTVRIELDMPVPASICKAFPGVGDHLGWEERSVCDFAAGTIDFDIRLPHLGSRIEADGRYALREGGAGRKLRHIAGEVRVAVPVVGAVAERAVVHRLKENMDEEARLTASFLRERSL